MWNINSTGFGLYPYQSWWKAVKSSKSIGKQWFIFFFTFFSFYRTVGLSSWTIYTSATPSPTDTWSIHGFFFSVFSLFFSSCSPFLRRFYNLHSRLFPVEPCRTMVSVVSYCSRWFSQRDSRRRYTKQQTQILKFTNFKTLVINFTDIYWVFNL